MRLLSSTFKRYAGLFLGLVTLFVYIMIAFRIERQQHMALGLCILALFVAYFSLLRLKLTYKSMLIAGLVFRLVFLCYQPAFSEDFFRFIWDGRLLLKGISPYLFTPNQIISSKRIFFVEINALYQGMGPLSQRNFSNYPPIHQIPAFIAAIVSSKSIFVSLVSMRLILILADLGILYYGRKLLGLFKMPKNAIFIYFLNPLVIIELSGNLHHEGLMVFFMLLAFYHLKRKKLFYAAVFMGVSVLTKLIPLLLLPLFFPKLGRVKSLPFFGTIAGVIILGFSPFINLEFIVNYTQSVGLWFSNFEFNASLYYVLKIVLKHFFELNLITYMRFIVPLIMGSTLLYFISRKQSKTRTIIIQSLWLLSAYFFISTTIHPWYLIPLVFLSCFGNYRFPLWWSFSVFLSYAAYFQNEVYENPYLLVIEYGTLMAVLIYECIVKAPKIKASSTD